MNDITCFIDYIVFEKKENIATVCLSKRHVSESIKIEYHSRFHDNICTHQIIKCLHHQTDIGQTNGLGDLDIS